MSEDERQPPEIIRVEGVSKVYRRTLPGDRLRTLKSALVGRSLASGLKPEESIAALETVDFAVHAGEAFGVIGGNGSGKSTLLKMVAGMLKPTTGRITVAGRVAALIELGAGFHPEISGRENVFINGAVLGLTRKQIERRYADIVEFSGLGDFMEEPVKNYSSGMYVRLGFAVAVNTDPDVLLVDEVLAVGDEAFAHRCLRRIEEFLAGGKTLLLVSHSLDLVEGVCDRVLWLDNGRQRLVGEPRRVIDAYRQEVAEREGEEHLAAKRQREESGEAVSEELRWGSREAEILSSRMIVGGEETISRHYRRGRHLRDPRPGRAAARRLRLRRGGLDAAGPGGLGHQHRPRGVRGGRASRARPRCASPPPTSGSLRASTWWTSPSTPRRARPTTTTGGRWPSR